MKIHNSKWMNKIKSIGKPLEQAYSSLKDNYGKKHLKWQISRTYKHLLGRDMNWKTPEDLNEKINWLKLHADPYQWAMLADKYRVREYVKGCGLEEILVPLYGHWNTADAFIADFDKLPEEFVLKSNNGNGRVLIISKENGGKNAVNLTELHDTLDNWIKRNYSGVNGTEPHYRLIDNCIVAEKYLNNNMESINTSSVIDYKIWCFNGKPYGCFVCYDRNISGHTKEVLFYDLAWNERNDVLSNPSSSQHIPKPSGWDKMIEIAEKLSKGHPQARVDLYNINGIIYFGEITMTAKAGYMTVFNQRALLDMGKQIHLDMSTPWNMFAT